jgi:hypothetical protein
MPASRLGARINAMFSTDNGHFDVQDMRKPVAEAWELVEDGLLIEDDFRNFAFANAVRLCGTQNARFFEGTAVTEAAAAVLAAAPAHGCRGVALAARSPPAPRRRLAPIVLKRRPWGSPAPVPNASHRFLSSGGYGRNRNWPSAPPR